jgi:UDP:flavonoid glycosyltransferase YjiC (YdhE family)
LIQAADYTSYRAGIPQIILAQWFDLYDTAARVEYIGIGIYGNRSVAPDIDATEFGAAISRLLSPREEAEKFVQTAKEIGELCRGAPGKKGAAAKILELVGASDCTEVSSLKSMRSRS